MDDISAMSAQMADLDRKVSEAEAVRKLSSPGSPKTAEEEELETTLANMAAMLQATERRLDDREDAALQAVAGTTSARLSAVENRIQESEAQRKKAELDELEAAKEAVFAARKAGIVASFEVSGVPVRLFTLCQHVQLLKFLACLGRTGRAAEEGRHHREGRTRRILPLGSASLRVRVVGVNASAICPPKHRLPIPPIALTRPLLRMVSW